MYRNGNASAGSSNTYVGGSIGTSGSISYGEQPDGSFVDSQGSNINLGGDSCPGFLHLVAPAQ